MNREIHLIKYLPEYLQPYCELSSVLESETEEFISIEVDHNQMVDDRYLATCGEYGVSRFEKLLSILPLSDDTLENRRFRGITRWNSAIPYNYQYLTLKLNMLCGSDGYNIVTDFKNYKIYFYIDVKNEKNMESVRELIHETLPCNMVWAVYIIYRRWKDAAAMKWVEASNITWNNLRRGETNDNKHT